jgi:predicted ATPase
MQELYGVNEAGLAAYFLDPTKAAPILTRQAEAAKIAARAKEQGRLQLGFATAEEIAARGITAQEAEAGFTALGLQEGLYTEMMGEQALTQQQKVGAALGYDVEAQRQTC